MGSHLYGLDGLIAEQSNQLNLTCVNSTPYMLLSYVLIGWLSPHGTCCKFTNTLCMGK